MNTWGERLRQRARELGLTDVEVARRLGLAQGRYSAYVNETREPDFALFLRICAALSTTPDVMLGVTPLPEDARPAVSRLLAAAAGMDDSTLEMAAAVVAAMAAFHPSEPAPQSDGGAAKRGKLKRLSGSVRRSRKAVSKDKTD